jgi:type VI protein secretion system component Hcp
MAVDMFLKLGDIKGESQDDKHKDEIEVQAGRGAPRSLEPRTREPVVVPARSTCRT